MTDQCIVDNQDGGPDRHFQMLAGTLKTSSSYTGFYRNGLRISVRFVRRGDGTGAMELLDVAIGPI